MEILRKKNIWLDVKKIKNLNLETTFYANNEVHIVTKNHLLVIDEIDYILNTVCDTVVFKIIE